MESELRRIPGIGDETIGELADGFPSESALEEATLSELQDVPRITAPLAVHIKTVVCDPSLGPTDAVDEDAPRLSERFSVPDETVNTLHSSLSNRRTGRDSDLENLLRHSLAAQHLPVEDYRAAFENHQNLIANEIPEYPGDFPISDSAGLTEEQVDSWNASQRERQMSQRRSRQMNDVALFIPVVLDSSGPFGTKMDAIIALKTIFDPVLPRALPGYMITDHIGCSSGYASEFELVDIAEQEVVLRKEYAARRQLEKAESWQREAVLDRDDGKCVRCGASGNLVVHHITPIEAGGSDELENMATLCRSCHDAAHGGTASTSDVVYDPESFWSWANTGI